MTATSRQPCADSDCLTLAATPTAPRQARRFATQVLQKWQTPTEVIGSAEIIVSELVTNAYQAICPDGRQHQLTASETSQCIISTLWRLPGLVVIEVSDHDQAPPVHSEAHADAEGGRGLMLVQALSDQWGYRHSPLGGKVVYAILGVPQ